MQFKPSADKLLFVLPLAEDIENCSWQKPANHSWIVVTYSLWHPAQLPNAVTILRSDSKI